MEKIELFVSLKIPDNTAITAFHTLKGMGFAKLRAVKRLDYYSFSVNADKEAFAGKIMKTDVLVNANKHNATTALPSHAAGVAVLVTDNEKPCSLLHTLQKRLGMTEIQDMDKGMLWQLDFDLTKEEAVEQAKRAAEELLCSRHYQAYSILH